MWLATKHGFYSVVHKNHFFQVRGRTREDLHGLLVAANMEHIDILVDTGTDYGFRVLLQLPELFTIMATLAQGIDYSNFKDRIASLPEQRPKLEAYHELWRRLKQLQDRVNARRGGA